MTAELAPHPVIVAFAERGGTQLHTLRRTHFVDIGEQNLFNFSRGRQSGGIEKSGVVGELVGSFLPQVCLYHCLEPNDYGRSCQTTKYI